ncbi:hypothetical protein ABZW11_26550 [Nonomuraea sp. NPDC004580]|uniref:hypothetical protein n=1 Tax=Nonomuraea sp. NPDC004580 TaxID=3154552 RepID=UPI0033B83731
MRSLSQPFPPLGVRFRLRLTIEPITADLRRDTELPTEATLVVVERHAGRLAKVCSTTDTHAADLASWGHAVTIEDLALGIAHTYGAVYVPSTAIRTVPARGGLLGYQVHALRKGAPLPGGHRIVDVDDYGSDTHVGIVGSDGRIHRVHRHTEIRELESGVVRLVEPGHSGWAGD